MHAEDVLAFCADAEAHGIQLWLMGGWGVDALLGRQTREHHDLDLLVEVRGLERLQGRLDALGFTFRYVWDEETWWVDDPSWSEAQRLPTAFVYGAADGREIDVHVIRVAPDGAVETLWTVPYAISAAGLGGRGTIAGTPVPCLTVEMQCEAHTGYELPPHHVSDLALLADLPTH